MWTIKLNKQDDDYYYFGFSPESNKTCDSEMVISKKDYKIKNYTLKDDAWERDLNICYSYSKNCLNTIIDGEKHTFLTH